MEYYNQKVKIFLPLWYLKVTGVGMKRHRRMEENGGGNYELLWVKKIYLQGETKEKNDQS